MAPATSRAGGASGRAPRHGPNGLWTIDGAGYIQVGRVVGEISANRTNVGTRSIPLLRSRLAAGGAYLSVRYGSDGGGTTGRLPTVRSQPSAAGAIRSEHADLGDGHASATVQMRH